MLIEYDRYSIASHWVCPIEYGDYSGLKDSEIKDLEEFLESLPRGPLHWSWSDNQEFAKDEITGLMEDCLEGALFVHSGQV